MQILSLKDVLISEFTLLSNFQVSSSVVCRSLVVVRRMYIKCIYVISIEIRNHNCWNGLMCNWRHSTDAVYFCNIVLVLFIYQVYLIYNGYNKTRATVFSSEIFDLFFLLFWKNSVRLSVRRDKSNCRNLWSDR